MRPLVAFALLVGCHSALKTQGGTCTHTADCISGLFCTDGVCGSAKCRSDNDCPATEHCQPAGDCKAVVGTCTAATCATLTTPRCGSIGDGCGGTITCECANGHICGAAGLCTCTPETDAALCGQACGSLSITDNCGVTRAVDCTCVAPATCSGAQQCVCDAESDAQFCWRVKRMCGAAGGTDICGFSRSVAECGPCLGGTTCTSDGTCTPLCAGAVLTGTGTVVGTPPAGHQDIFGGATMDGTTILDRDDPSSCGGTAVYQLFDRNGSGYTITTFASPFSAGEQNIHLEDDGLTIVGVTTAGTTFGEIKRSARLIADFSAIDSSHFGALAVSTGSVAFPVMSADKHFLFYLQSGTAADGIYMAERDDPAGDFAAGAKLDFPASYFVTGISADDLSLFVQNTGYAVSFYNRPSPWTTFSTTSTASVPGFRTQPLEACTSFIGTCHGGCDNEDICTY